MPREFSGEVIAHPINEDVPLSGQDCALYMLQPKLRRPRYRDELNFVPKDLGKSAEID